MPCTNLIKAERILIKVQIRVGGGGGGQKNCQNEVYKLYGWSLTLDSGLMIPTR